MGAPPVAGGCQFRVTREPDTDAAMLRGRPGAAAVGTVTVALAVAVAPFAPTAVIVKVVVPLTATDVDPDGPTETPLIDADTALVVCQLTSALPPWRVAVICAVGGAVLGVTVALAGAVRPSAARAVIVNVVCEETATEAEPVRPTVVPLILADVAFAVCHDTSADVADCIVAVMFAVGAGEVPRLIVASAEYGPY